MYVPRANNSDHAGRLQEMEQRRQRCETIAFKACMAGLDVSWEKVNRHYGWFIRWDEGRLATGYLIRRTGIRRIS